MSGAGGFNHTIHGARGLFCFGVFFYHVHNSGLPTYSMFESGLLYQIFDVGKYGVELFFGISGLVIVGSIARTTGVRDFAVNRITRIMPTLWASILVIAALYLVTGTSLPSAPQLLLNFASPPPFIVVHLLNPAAWSLQYELTFYAIVAVVLLLHRTGSRWMSLPIIVGLVLLIFYPRGLMLVSGTAIALGIGTKLFEKLSRYPGVLLLIFLALWRATEIGFGWADPEGGLDIAAVTPLHLPVGQWLAGFVLMLLATCIGTIALDGLYRERGLLARFLRTPLMQWGGLISYSFYIWHPVSMAVSKGAMKALGLVELAGPHAQLLFFCIALPPSLVIAALSQAILEKRLTNYLRGLRGSSSARKPVDVPVV